MGVARVGGGGDGGNATEGLECGGTGRLGGKKEIISSTHHCADLGWRPLDLDLVRDMHHFLGFYSKGGEQASNVVAMSFESVSEGSPV